MSFSIVSDTGCPEVGNPAMGTGTSEACCSEGLWVLTSMLCCSRISCGEAVRCLDLTGLLVVGVDAAEEDPLGRFPGSVPLCLGGEAVAAVLPVPFSGRAPFW